MTLTEFLLARYDEAEAEAGEVHAHHCGDLEYIRFYGWRPGEPLTCDCGQPARVLADIEAKRRIVKQYISHPQPNLYLALCALALPYADHPDYLEEWRP